MDPTLESLFSKPWTKDFLLLNPRLPESEKKYLDELFSARPKNLAPHIYLSSSGSTTQSRLVALSREAFLSAAESVNDFLQIQKGEPWLLALPHFHVGGLSIFARARLSQSPVYNLEGWSADDFCVTAQKHSVALSSLVPAQVFDLVQRNLKAPPSLRAVLVGAASLDRELYTKARNLAWPLLRSYGATETAAAFAISPLSSLEAQAYPDMEILPHWKAGVGEAKELQLRGPALASGDLRMTESGGVSWRSYENFSSSDRVEICGQKIEFLGRGEDFVKILGEGVNTQALLRKLWAMLPALSGRSCVVTEADPRRGLRLVLVVESEGLDPAKTASDLRGFNAQVAPFERLSAFACIEKIPRSELSKVLFQKLRSILLVSPLCSLE